jgi:hypothetical protein
MGIFCNSKINAEFLKLLEENPKISKKQSHESIPNNGSHPKQNTSGTSSAQPSASAFDFLTGDFDMPTQPADSSTKGSTDFSIGGGIDFLDSPNDEVNPFAASLTAETNKSSAVCDDDFNPFAASKSNAVSDDDLNPFSSSEASSNRPMKNDFNPFASFSATSSDKPVKNDKINPNSVDTEIAVDEVDEAYDNTKNYLDLYRSFAEANRVSLLQPKVYFSCSFLGSLDIYQFKEPNLSLEPTEDHSS